MDERQEEELKVGSFEEQEFSMEKPEKGRRKCLKCESLFQSKDLRRNRCCGSCRKTNAGTIDPEIDGCGVLSSMSNSDKYCLKK